MRWRSAESRGWQSPTYRPFTVRCGREEKCLFSAILQTPKYHVGNQSDRVAIVNETEACFPLCPFHVLKHRVGRVAFLRFSLLTVFSSTDLTIFLLADLTPALLGDVTIFLLRGTSIRFGVSGPLTTYRLTQAAVARRARLTAVATNKIKTPSLRRARNHVLCFSSGDGTNVLRTSIHTSASLHFLDKPPSHAFSRVRTLLGRPCVGTGCRGSPPLYPWAPGARSAPPGVEVQGLQPEQRRG